MNENKTNILVIIGIVFALILSTISICGLIYVNNTNNDRWDEQKNINDVNSYMWDKQIEINDLVIKMFDLIKDMIY